MKKRILGIPILVIIIFILVGAGAVAASVLIGGGGNTENVNLQKGLMGHWKLDNNAKDATPYANDGTLGLSNSMDITSNLTMWFKADAITGLNDGDVVTTWSDSSGNGNDITQGTAANKPVYKTGILNSKPVVRFDVTDLLSRSVTASNIIGMNTATVFLVMKHNSADTQTSVMGLGDCVSNRFNFHAPYDTSIVWQYGDETVSSIGFTKPDGWSDNWHVVGLWRSGDTMTIYNDGVQAASDSDNTDSFNDVSTTFNLGDGSCPNSWTGDIAEFLIYNTALSDADRISVDAYLRNKYSVYSSSPILTTDRKGQLNKAYNFDGTNDAVDAGTGTNLDLGSGDLTLSAWIYLDAYNNQGSLWNAIIMDGELVDVPGSFYGFATDSSLKVYFGARDIDTNAVSNSAVNGKWVHAVGVRTSDVLTLYIDGVLQADTGAGSGTLNNAVPLYFGRDNITSRYFDGSIDDVRVYNRALSQTEITALYQEYDPGIVISDLQKGLVGQWKFDGNAKDSTPYGNNGAFSGDAAATVTDRKGQTNKAATFDGTGDYVSVVSAASLHSSALSVGLWFNVNNLSATRGLIGRFNGTYTSEENLIRINTDGQVQVNFRANSADNKLYSNAGDIVAGNWYHLVATFIQGTQKLYLNGILEDTETVNDSLEQGNSNTIIGYEAGYENYMNGSIDEVRVYNRALSATEITALYQEYDPGIIISDLQKGLVGQWKFNGNAKDSTPYGNNGTVIEATLTTDRKGQVNKAYSFDGTDDYVDVGTPAISTNGPATLSGWFYITQSANAKDDYNNLFSRGTGISMLFQHPSNNFFYTEGGYFAYVPPLNQWLHIALTYSGQTSTAILYVNGVEKTIQLQTESNITVFNKISSATGVGRKYAFSGYIDDVRVYNRALSATEITALYQSY